MSYFDKFPIIVYNGKYVRNITARVALAAKSIADIKQYQPYDLPEGVRADELAYDYYGAASSDWMLYLSNETIDPYYDWPLDNNILDDFIIKKYGSTTIAREGISHYRVNYKNDNTIIDSVAYNSLTSGQKYYWTIDVNSVDEGILSYKRKPIDNIVHTNKTQQVSVSNTTGLIVDERIKQYSGFSLVGSAQISQIINSTALIVDKVTGTLSNGSFQTSQSEITDTITDVITISTNIGETSPDNVSLYWEPVTYYEFEHELNENKRQIYALDRSIQSDVEKVVSNLLLDNE